MAIPRRGAIPRYEVTSNVSGLPCWRDDEPPPESLWETFFRVEREKWEREHEKERDVSDDMTEDVAEATNCPHCGKWIEAHTYEHEARKCYPIQVAKLEAQLAQATAALKAEAERNAATAMHEQKLIGNMRRDYDELKTRISAQLESAEARVATLERELAQATAGWPYKNVGQLLLKHYKPCDHGGFINTLKRILSDRPKSMETRLRSAARALVDACRAADADGDLSEHIDGALMEAMETALANAPGEAAEAQLADAREREARLRAALERYQEYVADADCECMLGVEDGECGRCAIIGDIDEILDAPGEAAQPAAAETRLRRACETARAELAAIIPEPEKFADRNQWLRAVPNKAHADCVVAAYVTLVDALREATKPPEEEGETCQG